jgi:putative endonuclease
MEKQPAVYILAQRRYGVLYTGVTSNLIGRTWQHREYLVEDFATKYNVVLLVWYELHDTMYSAIAREKQIKKWRREWKVELIEKENPNWDDLWNRIIGVGG